jgi:ribosomal protein S18 acetylase RimI-like enzyme
VADPKVVRDPGELHWQVPDDGGPTGEVRAWVRPDARCSVWFGRCDPDCYAPLLAAVAADVPHDLYIEQDESDTESLTRFVRLGFTVNRQEGNYLLPTDPGENGLLDVKVPGGVSLISAAEADENRLRVLDDLLREDIPGADGWRWDPPGFHAETFSSQFDPETYLVAVGQSGEYAGLVRVWIRPGTPRLGCIAVTREYRRTGLARALLARAFGVVHRRGQPAVSAEVDSGNRASLTLMTSLGARRTGGAVELVKRRAARLPMKSSLRRNVLGHRTRGTAEPCLQAWVLHVQPEDRPQQRPWVLATGVVHARSARDQHQDADLVPRDLPVGAQVLDQVALRQALLGRLAEHERN